MSEPADRFSVGIAGSEGIWPNLPRTWSYSSLREATECPRRWMLSRASYPDLWNHWGYPPKPSLPALLGDVVHGALERLLRDFREHGCASLADPGTVAVLKNLGGYSQLAEHGIEEQLTRLAENPRMSERIGPLRTALRIKVPEIRQRVQAVIARTPLRLIGEAAASGEGGPGGRGPLAPGFYPEVDLRAADLRLAGRADLLTVLDEACDITDYKTGSPDAHHADQVRLYALLWSRDQELNPHSLPVHRLILSYASHDVDVDPPSNPELNEIAADTAEQIGEAEAALLERPPTARPEASMCRYCGVRQLCDEYWAGLPGEDDAEWFDFEGTVSKRNGARSWVLVATAPTDRTLLLRTSSEVVPFGVGDHLRLLDLHREDDSESVLPIGTLTQASEIFTVEVVD